MSSDGSVLMSKSGKDSSPAGRLKKRLGFFLAVVLWAWCPPANTSFSQESNLPHISKVDLLVDGRPAEREMENLISLHPGELFSLQKISRNIKQIYETGLFSDVQVGKQGEIAVELTFSLTKRLTIRDIDFEGEQGISTRKLRESVSGLRRGGFFAPDKLRLAEQEIKSALRQEGYFDAQIKNSSERDLKAGSVKIVFRVESSTKYKIKAIGFSGDVQVPPSELIKKIKSRPGADYVPAILEQDLARLKGYYNGLGYQRAEAELDSENFDQPGSTVSLNIKINPQEKIKIVINGAQLPVNLLTPIWEERIFEEWGMSEGEARIISYLRSRGYLFATSKARLEKTGNEIKVIYDVISGERFRIQDISFEGLKYFSAAQLKNEIGIGEKIPLLSWIDGQRLFEVPEEIEFLYQARGFPSPQVNLDFIKKKNAVRAVFHIEEGSQQKIKTLTLVGAHLISPAELRARITSTENGPFFSPNIQRDIGEIEAFYQDRGIRGTRVTSEIRPEGQNLFSLIFQISEGQRITLDKIVITGNRVTRRRTIVREIRVVEGQPAYLNLIQETKRRLENTGIFSEVKMEEIPTSGDRENLVISLLEGDRNYAGLGIGLETKYQPQTSSLFNNVVRPRGTAEYIRSNVFGTGSQLSLVTQFSLQQKRGVAAWEEPYFFGLPLQNSLTAWLESEERVSFGYNRSGTSFSGIKSLTKNLTLLLTLAWQRTELTFLFVPESEVDRQFFPYSATYLSGSFFWDRRDDSFNPERGWFLSSVAEWAFPLFKAESNYFKTYTKFQHFFRLKSWLNLSLTSRLGLGRGRMPIPERFFAGGSNSFRGEPFDELGPKVPVTRVPVGGKALLLFNFELKFPVLSALKDLSGAVFYDWGNVFAKRSNFNLADLQSAVGLGVRYRTPLGPLRFELGWNLDDPQRKGRPLAFITIGNVF